MKKNFLYILDIRQGCAQMNLFDHCVEMRQRLFWVLSIFLFCFLCCVCNISLFVDFLRRLSPGVRFFQLAPGGYFFSALKISLHISLVLIVPYLVLQVAVFVSPGVAKCYREYTLYFIFFVLVLFLFGVVFGFFVLVPTATLFFSEYGFGLMEPFWSFEQYSDFVVTILLNSGLVFLLPVFQVIFGIFRIFSSSQMILHWRWVFFLSSIVSGVLTPSVDPFTQIIMGLVLVFLYCLGVCLVFLIEELDILEKSRFFS